MVLNIIGASSSFIPSSGGPPPPDTEWNPADKSANVVLTNNNLTASVITIGDGGVRSLSSKTSGLYYVELTWVNASGGASGFGIATAGATFTGAHDLAADATNGCICYCTFGSGDIYYNGANASVGMGAGLANGDTGCLALDMTHHTFWTRRNNGLWLNSGTGPGDEYRRTLSSTVFKQPSFPRRLFQWQQPISGNAERWRYGLYVYATSRLRSMGLVNVVSVFVSA